MKKVISILCLLLLISCKGAYQTSSGGYEDEGYVSVVGDPEKYKAGVLVSVDGASPFIVEVVQDEKISKSDSRFKVSAGKHQLKMMYQGKNVFQQNVIIFVQETKKIMLP